MAQQFNPRSLALAGEALPVAEQVQFAQGYALAVFSVSPTGVLVYQPGSAAPGNLRWFDANGKELSAPSEPGSYSSLRLSPDGQRLSVAIADTQGDKMDLWLLDLTHHVRSRLTFEPGLNTFPVWSPDGTRVLFSSSRKGTGDLYWKLASGASDEELLLEGLGNKRSTDWSRDGRNVAFQLNDGTGKTNWDIWILPLTGGPSGPHGAGQKPIPFLQSQFNEIGGVFSPDGRWMAYQSDETGAMEVYVAPFPGRGGKFLISSEGGRLPTWSPDGRQLFYLTLDNKLMAVDVSLGPTSIQHRTPRPLFATRVPSGVLGARGYDVAPGGGKFVTLDSAESSSDPVTLVVNWAATLKK